MVSRSQFRPTDSKARTGGDFSGRPTLAAVTRMFVTAGGLVALLSLPAAAPAQSPEPDAAALAAAVGSAYQRHHFGAAIYGVWRDGREVTVGAVGRSQPGVPATTDMHFRIGNTAESFLSTLLVRYAEQGRLRLDDPLSKLMPSFPRSR